MPQDDHIYRVIELAGTSEKSVEDAIADGDNTCQQNNS